MFTCLRCIRITPEAHKFSLGVQACPRFINGISRLFSYLGVQRAHHFRYRSGDKHFLLIPCFFSCLIPRWLNSKLETQKINDGPIPPRGTTNCDYNKLLNYLKTSRSPSTIISPQTVSKLKKSDRRLKQQIETMKNDISKGQM